jgi:hypothetical protein
VTPVLAPERPLSFDLEPRRPAADLRPLTLEDCVVGAWEDLLVGAPAACPACGGELRARHSAGAGVVGGRCGGCGSSLS